MAKRRLHRDPLRLHYNHPVMRFSRFAFPWALSLMLLMGGLLQAAVPPPPMAGNSHARVHVIIFEDLECPSCAQWHQKLISQFLPQFGHSVAFQFHDFPLPQHTWSFNAAVVSRFFAVRRPELYFPWRTYCFAHQDQITPDNLIDKAAQFAASSGISRAEIESAFGQMDLFQAVETDRALGEKWNVQHTPTIYVEGRQKVEVSTPEQFVAAVKAALAEK